ncbi:hypothetical protein [Methylotuvimicrobium sp. KM1]|uniref:hypothetical protein n=1 Tax=Methylotuvimicrobium sp. KM1 TaxID=3377707 RepID=UPI00384E531A
MNIKTVAVSAITAVERNFADSLMVFRLDFRAHRPFILFGITTDPLNQNRLMLVLALMRLYKFSK